MCVEEATVKNMLLESICILTVLRSACIFDHVCYLFLFVTNAFLPSAVVSLSFHLFYKSISLEFKLFLARSDAR